MIEILFVRRIHMVCCRFRESVNVDQRTKYALSVVQSAGKIARSEDFLHLHDFIYNHRLQVIGNFVSIISCYQNYLFYFVAAAELVLHLFKL